MTVAGPLRSQQTHITIPIRSSLKFHPIEPWCEPMAHVPEVLRRTISLGMPAVTHFRFGFQPAGLRACGSNRNWKSSSLVHIQQGETTENQVCLIMFQSLYRLIRNLYGSVGEPFQWRVPKRECGHAWESTGRAAARCACASWEVELPVSGTCMLAGQLIFVCTCTAETGRQGDQCACTCHKLEA